VKRQLTNFAIRDDPDSQTVKISVVIPVYNEVKTIVEVINRVLECGFDTEIVVVNDASSDGTGEFLRVPSPPREST
jgi:cellulose synthase/poly-beta-1,6-N-acetylglucosamine synthase-like glycosyltransferase